jgi:hypothetical protein
MATNIGGLDMSKNDEDTCSLTLRRIRRRTSAVLYELKILTGLTIYELINRIVVYYVENHPSMLQMRLEEVRRLVGEYGAKDGTS